MMQFESDHQRAEPQDPIEDELVDEEPPALSKNVLIRDVVLRFVHAAFPGAALRLPPPAQAQESEAHDDQQQPQQHQQQEEGINLDLIAAGVAELADLLRNDDNSNVVTDQTTRQQQRVALESVQANQDLLGMCQKLLGRLQDTKEALAPSPKQRRRRQMDQTRKQRLSSPSTSAVAAPPVDCGLDLDFLLGNAARQQQQQQHQTTEGGGDDDAISAMRRRIEQLEDERDALLESCSVLTLQLRNARSTVDNATRKFEAQCFKAFDELARVHVAVESLREQPVATNVASVGSSSITDMELLLNLPTGGQQQHHHHHQQQQQRRDSTPYIVVSGSNEPFPVVPQGGSGGGAAVNAATSTAAAAATAGAAVAESDVKRLAPNLHTVADPLDRVYLQSYPALGMGMLLQTIAVVFKHEYDVMKMGDGGSGPASDDRGPVPPIQSNCAAASAAAAAAAAAAARSASEERKDDEEEENKTSKPDDNHADEDDAHFENACRQFQLALQKDVGPLLSNLSTLQHQMGLLTSSGASVRGDYVSKCLQAHIKPNSGVMKALTAIASTDRRRIRALDLSDFLVGDHGLAPLAATVESMYRLRRLDLRGNNLHAAGIRALCTMLRRHPCITEVDLRGNPVGRAGAKLLLGLLAECSRIEKIVIDDRAVESTLLARFVHKTGDAGVSSSSTASPSAGLRSSAQSISTRGGGGGGGVNSIADQSDETNP